MSRILSLGMEIAAGIRRGGRALDADIYEALGFRVQREPIGRSSFSWRYFNPEGRRWQTLEYLSSSVDECSRFIEQRHPSWAWTVSNIGPDEEPHAVVTLDDERCTDVEASVHPSALALAAALCLAEAASQ